ncbi:hypothetical protein [Klebsiella pneumoniae]|uniref:hypothetical protein n=1 Tax=Klebsiella pneumoniae TaxID=573 RepID=UPI00265B51F1|nr:hypothetical protein [Klebsiella pneumoniae]
MTTDITELAQRMKAAAGKATPGRIGDRIDGSGSIKYQCLGNDGSLVLQTDHKNMEYGFVGPNAEADELFFRECTPDNILALVEALEKAQRHANLTGAERQAYLGLISKRDERIAELEQKHCGGALVERELAHSQVINKLMSEIDNRDSRIAELESRTVKIPGWFVKDAMAFYDRDEIEEALSAAGIKWEAE